MKSKSHNKKGINDMEFALVLHEKSTCEGMTRTEAIDLNIVENNKILASFI